MIINIDTNPLNVHASKLCVEFNKILSITFQQSVSNIRTCICLRVC